MKIGKGEGGIRGEWGITKGNKTIHYDENGRETDPAISALNGSRTIRNEDVEFEESEGDTGD